MRTLSLEVQIKRVREYVEQLEPAAKRRVATATKWTTGAYVDWRDPEKRCLVGHAADMRLGSVVLIPYDESAWVGKVGAEGGFDTVADALGLNAAVALVKDAAGALK